jgi:hypothetical protein
MKKNEKKVFYATLILAILFLGGVFFPLRAENFQPEQSRIKVNALYIPQTVYELHSLKARSEDLQRWIGATADKGIMEWAYSEEQHQLVPKNWVFLIENNGLIVGLIATDPVTDGFSWRTAWDINRHINKIREIFSFEPMSIEGECISALDLKSPSDYDFQEAKLVIIRGKHYWVVPKKEDIVENFLIAPIEALNKVGVFGEFKKNLRPKGMGSVEGDSRSSPGIHSDLNERVFTPPDRFNESQVTVQATDTEMNGEVPIYCQGSTSNCWAYSLAMVHQWWSPINLGTGDTQVQAIRDYIGLGPDDTATLADVHEIMANWPSVDGRFEDFPMTGYGEGDGFGPGGPTWTGTDPKTWLALEAPVIAAIDSEGQGPSSFFDHFVVVTGYNDDTQTVYVNNPWGLAGTYSYGDFNEKYWGAWWSPTFQHRGMVCGLAGDNSYVSLSSHSVTIPDLQMYDNEEVVVGDIGLSVSGDNAGGGWDSFGHFNYRNTFDSSLGRYLDPGHILIDFGVTSTPVWLGNWETYTPEPPSRNMEFFKQDLSSGESVNSAYFYVKVDPSGCSGQIRVNNSWTVWDHNDRTHYQGAGRHQVYCDGVVKDGNMMMLTPMRIRTTVYEHTDIKVDDDDTTPPTITNLRSSPVSPVDGSYNGDILLYAYVDDSQSGIDYVKFIYRYGSGSNVERDGIAGMPIGTFHCTIPKGEWTQNRGATIYWKVEAADADNDCAGDSSIGYSPEQALVLSPGVMQYALNISVGEGGTTEPAPGTYNYDSGTEVTVTAKPKSGYNFSDWTGDMPSGHEKDNPLTLTMDSDRSIICHFSPVSQVGWTPAKRLTWTSGSSLIPAIAVGSSDKLHVVWGDNTPGNFEIYYKKSTDGGAAWTAIKRLTWTSGTSLNPAIVVGSSGNLHLVWDDDTPGNFEIFYKKSTDGGATWSSSKRLTSTSGSSANPAIVVGSSDKLHVVWEDSTPGNLEIFYKKSTDGGATWSTSKRLTSTSGSSRNPAIVVGSSGNLHLVWDDDTTGNSEIYYKKSTDGGATWSTDKRLTFTSGFSYFPDIAIDSTNHIHVVWEDSTPGNPEIYYRRSTDGGATWSTDKRLTWTSGESASPAISIDLSGNLHVVWGDKTPGEIYYKKSTDGGATWTTVQRLTSTSGSSTTAAIASDPSGNLHVIWQDNTPGNDEIYYRKYVK